MSTAGNQDVEAAPVLPDPPGGQGFRPHSGMDDDFMVKFPRLPLYRTFDYLTHRHLMFLSQKLSGLEMRAMLLDRDARSRGQAQGATLPADLAANKELADEIEPLLREYQETLIRFCDIRDFHDADHIQRGIITGGIQEDIPRKTFQPFFDLDSFVEELESAPDVVVLDREIDMQIKQPSLYGVFRHAFSELIHQHSQRGTYAGVWLSLIRNVAAATSFTLFTSIVLVGPIIGLYFIPNPKIRLGAVAAIAAIFSISLGVFGTIDRQTQFAATAAYVAILVVFISGGAPS